MIASKHLRECIIRPALDDLKLYSLAREELLVITAAQESLGGHYLMQNDAKGYPKGPALGIYQEEPNTYLDCFNNFLRFQPVHYERLTNSPFSLTTLYIPPARRLVYDMDYATKAAVLQYYRFKEPLPDYADLRGLIAYYKKYWNTEKGAATLAETRRNYDRYIAQ